MSAKARLLLTRRLPDNVEARASRAHEVSARGIVVTNTPDVLTDATADITMLCLLGAARRGAEADRLLRAGDRENIALLPDGAVVVNTARGNLVDDEALIEALRSGKVAAAGLDVYDGEPAFQPAYVGLTNTFLLPHLGSATQETRDLMGFVCLDNIDAFFAGRPCPNPV